MTAAFTAKGFVRVNVTTLPDTWTLATGLVLATPPVVTENAPTAGSLAASSGPSYVMLMVLLMLFADTDCATGGVVSDGVDVAGA